MIHVYLHIERKKHRVGRLAQKNRDVLFQYDKGFLELGLQISPFHLPLNDKVFQAPAQPFNRLHGVFSDSLPDGWGLMLMDRHFRKKGIEPHRVTPIERLSYVGSTGIGALSYEPDMTDYSGKALLNMALISQEAEKIYQGETDDILPELYKIATSPGGARPKVLVGIKDNQIIAGEHNLPEGYVAWLIKFHTKTDKKCEEGLIEEAYAQMIKQCGIVMPETRLFEIGDKFFFGIKRFDRSNNRRLHTHTLAGLVHADFRSFDFDYKDFFKVTKLLTNCQNSIEQAYRQMVFNLLAVNRDDHTKNFSFIMESNGDWKLSPAYDMTFNIGAGGEHSMTLFGHGKNVPDKSLFGMAELVDIDAKTVKQIFGEISESVSKWSDIANSLGISSAATQAIQKEMDDQFKSYRSLIVRPASSRLS